LCRTTNLLVTDTFGLILKLAPAAVGTPGAGRTTQGSERWTMYSLTQAGGVSDWFCLPSTAADRTVSSPVEDVLCARDEMANLAWAIERLVEGPDGDPIDRGRETDKPPALTPPAVDRGKLRWVLGTAVPPFWYPLVPNLAHPGTFEVQVMGDAPATDLPQGRFISARHNGQAGTLIATDAVPREGRRLRRDYVAARAGDGTTLVWSRRRASVGRGEGSSALVFDRGEATPTGT
jgi:hypothetical protein